MAKGYGSGGSASLKGGLVNHSPKSADASTVMPKTSVNSDATRSSVGKATNNLGPREA
jgi:hypothetical protein